MEILVDLPYACYGITVSNGIVIDAAPIAKWMLGKNWNDIKYWILMKNGKFTICKELKC